MKFTSGYLLGASTVVGLGVSFIGGALAFSTLLAWVDERKNEELDKVKNISSRDLVADILRRGRN